MTRLFRILPLLLLVVLAVAMLARIAQMQDGPKNYAVYHDPMLGKPMPALTLPGLQEGEATLSTEALQGHAYLFNVFASWCSMCQVEHPQLATLKEQARLPLYGMAWKDAPQDTQRWLQRMGNIYDAVGSDSHGQAAIELGLTGAPETYLVAPDGRIAAIYRGALSEAVITTRFMPAITSLNEASHAQ